MNFDSLKMSKQNPIVNMFNMNTNKPTEKTTSWYSQYCQDCENLSKSQNNLDVPN